MPAPISGGVRIPARASTVRPARGLPTTGRASFRCKSCRRGVGYRDPGMAAGCRVFDDGCVALDPDFSPATLQDRVVWGATEGDPVRLHGALTAALNLYPRGYAYAHVFA